VDLFTLDDVETEGKKVLLRVDINCPIDPESNSILDDTRIKSHLPTIEELRESKLVIIAHQSRPGKPDFIPLKTHAVRLGELLGGEVKYIDDIFGSNATGKIKSMENGDILLLENVRFCSEEVHKNVLSKSPEEQAKTNFVRTLLGCVDLYVNDAFAVSHRSQPSVVAFPEVLPGCAGRLMEREIRSLSSALSSEKNPKVFLLGGAKVDDSLQVIKNVLEKGSADKVLVGGLVAHLFMAAVGHDIGDANIQELDKAGYTSLIPDARGVIENHEDKIGIPEDVAFQERGKRRDATLEKLSGKRIMDIGSKTIENYSAELKKAQMIVANGPMGVFELEGFERGTEELLRSMGESNAFSIIGGGHLSAVAKEINLSTNISHISTGGGACMTFLAGEALPGIEALKASKRRFGG